MAKRFSATELWEEDWYLDMPNEYKLFWFYMLSTCNHAGFYRVNLKRFCTMNDVKISAKKAVDLFNSGKDRVRVIRDDLWFIEDFITFQYGHQLNHKNKLHKSILEILNRFNINISSIRGVREVLNGSETGQTDPKDRTNTGQGYSQGKG